MGKTATRLTIDETVLSESKGLGINLSAAAEAGIRAELKRKKEEQWLKENKADIEAYNRKIETEGLWSDGLRVF